jgi:hypothetical protein
MVFTARENISIREMCYHGNVLKCLGANINILLVIYTGLYILNIYSLIHKLFPPFSDTLLSSERILD